MPCTIWSFNEDAYIWLYGMHHKKKHKARVPSKPFNFTGLPAEVRVQIYRMVLVARHPIGPDPHCEDCYVFFMRHIYQCNRNEENDDLAPRWNKRWWAAGRRGCCGHPVIPEPNILLTCRTIYKEAIPILYGDNTFEFTVLFNETDKTKPRVVLPCALSVLLYDRYRLKNTAAAKACVRQIRANVVYDTTFSIENPDEDSETIHMCRRHTLLNLGKLLNSLPPLRRFELNMHFGKVYDPAPRDWNTWKNSLPVDRSTADRYERRLIGLLQTWLGRLPLKDTKELVVMVGNGKYKAPEDFTNTLLERWRSDPNGNETWRTLLTEYEALERFVISAVTQLPYLRHPKHSIVEPARKAVENEDVAHFKLCNRRLRNAIRTRLYRAVKKRALAASEGSSVPAAEAASVAA